MHIQKQIATLLKEDIDQRVHPDDVRLVKMIIIETLKTCDEQEALVALVRGCFLKDNELTNLCKAAIKTLRLNKTVSIFDFIFAQESTIALQKKMFELMDELQGAQMLQYVLRTLNAAPERASEYQEFASWLRANSTREKYVRMAINLRQEAAKRAITILTNLDSSIPICLAQITEDLNPEKTIKALQILVELNLQGAVASMIPIRKLMRHPESQVRALIARLVGATLQNLFYIRFALSDPATTVRLSILESIELGEERISDKLADLLYTTLTDFDPRVRAKTAQIFHFYKDVIGLRTLVSMLEGDDALGRAYAAHFLGELKELSVRDTLQHLSQNDPNLPVRREATKALQTLEGEVEEIHEGFEALIGILTQRRLSGDGDLRIWDYLEGLDANTLKSMIESTGLSSEATQQFLQIVNELDVQGIAIPFLLATVVNEDGKIDEEKIVDLDHMKTSAKKIVQQLQSQNQGATTGIFNELTAMQQTTVKALLIPALKADPATMAESAKALHQLQYDIGTNTLREMLEDEDDSAKRKEAAIALSTISDTFAAEQLENLKDDPDPEIQRIAQEGLAKVSAKLKRNDVQTIQVTIVDTDITEFPTVTLYVRILDTYGQPLGDLEETDFTILEGEKSPRNPKLESRHTQKPIAVAMVMDNSASMKPEEIEDVEAAIHRFTDQLLPTDQAAIVKFANDVEIMQETTGNKNLLQEAIAAQYNLSDQGTKLYDAILGAMHQLDSVTEGMKIVVANTDGSDDGTSKSFTAVRDYANDSKTAVYTIGLGDQVDTSTLKRIAHLTNGSYFAAQNSGELEDIYQAIFQGIRFEYVLSYTSKGAPQIDESNQNVSVHVTYGKCTEKATAILKKGI